MILDQGILFETGKVVLTKEFFCEGVKLEVFLIVRLEGGFCEGDSFTHAVSYAVAEIVSPNS